MLNLVGHKSVRWLFLRPVIAAIRVKISFNLKTCDMFDRPEIGSYCLTHNSNIHHRNIKPRTNHPRSLNPVNPGIQIKIKRDHIRPVPLDF